MHVVVAEKHAILPQRASMNDSPNLTPFPTDNVSLASLPNHAQITVHTAPHHTHHSAFNLQELRAKLLSEAEQSARQNAALAMRWADLFSVEVPQDLYEEIEMQRSACENIIGSKVRTLRLQGASWPSLGTQQCTVKPCSSACA